MKSCRGLEWWASHSAVQVFLLSVLFLLKTTNGKVVGVRWTWQRVHERRANTTRYRDHREVYFLLVHVVFEERLSVFNDSGRSKGGKSTTGRLAYSQFFWCKVNVEHSWKENVYKFNICNCRLWKDLSKPNLVAGKGYRQSALGWAQAGYGASVCSSWFQVRWFITGTVWYASRWPSFALTTGGKASLCFLPTPQVWNYYSVIITLFIISWAHLPMWQHKCSPLLSGGAWSGSWHVTALIHICG